MNKTTLFSKIIVTGFITVFLSLNIYASNNHALLPHGVSTTCIDQNLSDESSDDTGSSIANDDTGSSTANIPRHESVMSGRISVLVSDNPSPVLLNNTRRSFLLQSERLSHCRSISSNRANAGSPIVQKRSDSAAGSPIVLKRSNSTFLESSSNENNVNFIRQEIIKKFRNDNRIENNVRLTSEQELKIDSILKVFKPNVSNFLSNQNFSASTFKDLEKIQAALQKYDAQKKFWYGSLVVNDEYSELAESAKPTFYTGSMTLSKKRKDFLEERAEFTKKLLSEYH